MRDKPTVTATGNSNFRQRPEALLLVSSLKASAATLELALENLRSKCDAASEWLTRLKAVQIEFGEPRFPDQVEPNPMDVVRARYPGQKSRGASDNENAKEIIVSFTALWPIESMTSNEILIFADHLKFEAAFPGEAEESADPEVDPLGDDIQAQMEAMISQIHAKPNANAPQFLFLSRLSESQHAEALSKALNNARWKAKVLAQAAGKKLGELDNILCMGNVGSHAFSTSRIHRETLSPNSLSETSFGSDPNEHLSENPRAVDFSVQVNATFRLE